MNKLVDHYNNNHHRSIGKKPIDADHCALADKIERILKLNLKLVIESGLLSIRTLLVKVTLKIVQEKYLLSILCEN